MTKKIRVSKSILNNKEARAVSKLILRDGYLGMGKEVQKFEQELKKFFKADGDVICTNSGTAALHLAVASVTMPGDEVLVQSLTYVASFQAISASGAVPVSCEVNPETMTIDLVDAGKKITSKTRAIMPVHYASDPGDLKEIYKFAKIHNLRVIEDAAHAFGTTYDNKLIGSFGDIICFSFDGIKNITCGEGGAVLTEDKEVIQYIQDARLLGVYNDTKRRFGGQRTWEPDVRIQGYRYHMSNISAVIGQVQLKKFPIFKKIRQNLAKRYVNLLKNLEGVVLLEKDYNNIVPHIFPIKVMNDKRDELKKYLNDNNVECGVHYYPNHLLSFYKKPASELPITENVYNQILSLPLHPDLTKNEQNTVVGLIKNFLKK